MKKNWDFFTWRDHLIKSNLPSNSKLIGLYLSTFLNEKQCVAWPSQTRIRKETGLSNGAVNKHLGLLEKGNWIKRERGNSRKSTRYTATIPSAYLAEPLGFDTPPDGELIGLDTPPDGEGTLHQMETNKPINKPLFKKEIKKKKVTVKWVMPDWLNKTAWGEFEKHREDIKKPLTDLGRAKAVKKLIDLSQRQQQLTIDKTIENRWTGLFPVGERLNEISSRNSEPKNGTERLVRSCKNGLRVT